MYSVETVQVKQKSEVRCDHNKLKMKKRSTGHVGIDQLGVQEAKNDSEASN